MDKITSLIPISNHLCNITTCRSIIAYYILHNLTYNTINFSECSGCYQTSWPNFPKECFDRWYIQDSVIYSIAGQDCLGNPYTGNLTKCQTLCLSDNTCVGFSSGKNVREDDSNGQCWLKNNIQLNQTPNNPTWHTIVFNTTF